MKRAFSYIRFSDKRQARGDSRRRQLALSEAWCKRNGFVLDAELRFEDRGVSAREGRNSSVGALAEFREKVQGGRVPAGSVLIVESLDRLTRQEIDEALELLIGLLRLGVEIVTHQPERHYTRAAFKDPFALLEVLFILSRASEESATKSMRVRKEWEQRRQQMAKGPASYVCPAWLRVREGGRGFEVIPAARAAVLRIYELARDGYGIGQILFQLAKEKVRPIGRAKDHWARSYVTKLLASRAVIGECQPYVTQDGKLVPAGQPIKDYYPPIMSESEWLAAQRAKRSRLLQRGPRGYQVQNLFTGLLRDARNGMPLLVKGRSSRDACRRLVSTGLRAAGQPDSFRSFHYESFEAAFLELLQLELTSDLLRQVPKKRDREIAALAGELQEIERRLRAAQRAAASHPDFDSLLAAMTVLEETKRQTSTALEALKGQQATNHTETLGEARSIMEMMRTCPQEEITDLRTRLKGRIRTLVAQVWVLVDGPRGDRHAVVQVFFHKGAWLQFGCKRGSPLYPDCWYRENAEGLPRQWDLRQWRHLRKRPAVQFPFGVPPGECGISVVAGEV